MSINAGGHANWRAPWGGPQNYDYIVAMSTDPETTRFMVRRAGFGGIYLRSQRGDKVHEVILDDDDIVFLVQALLAPRREVHDVD